MSGGKLQLSGKLHDSEVAAFELDAPGEVATFAGIAPIGGVWWPREIAAPAPADGPEVALFDVDDAGELQEWEPRGDDRCTFVGRCARGHRVRTRGTVDAMRAAGWQVRCGSCNRWAAMEPVQATFNRGVRCSARCTNAVGPSCSCDCGGKNHGARYTVHNWEVRG